MSAGSRPAWSRRAFLLAAAAGAAGGAWYAFAPRGPSGHRDAVDQWQDWLLDAGNREAVARLGAAYRGIRPGEDDRALAAAIEAALIAQAGAGAMSSDSRQLGEIVQECVRGEYASARVVRVSGWVLSLTEARLYALVSSAGS